MATVFLARLNDAPEELITNTVNTVDAIVKAIQDPSVTVDDMIKQLTERLAL